jgi:hypothetical protein
MQDKRKLITQHATKYCVHITKYPDAYVQEMTVKCIRYDAWKLESLELEKRPNVSITMQRLIYVSEATNTYTTVRSRLLETVTK